MTPPVYAPYAGGSWALAMGLKPLDPALWIDPADDAAQLAEKAELAAAQRAVVVQALPGTEAAQEELLALLLAHLPRHLPQRFREDGAGLLRLTDGRRFSADEADPLTLAGLLVPEDFCLLTRDGERTRLVAGSLSFPSFWSLAEKLGQPMSFVHGPVPALNERLGRPIDMFFQRLAPDQLMWRLNWSLPTTPGLFQPEAGRPPPDDITIDNAGDRVFVRVERQTLRRLPASDTVVFTIRTFIDPVASLPPALAAGLAGAVRQLTPEMATYKGIGPFREALLVYLDRAGMPA